MAENEWALELVAGVAAEVKRIRKQRGLSVRELAELTEEIGYPMGVSVLTNFELGRRGSKLDVAELLVLAKALNVPPAHLLFPGYPEKVVRFMPNAADSSRKACDWLVGRARMSGWEDGDPIDESLLPLVEKVLEREAVINADETRLYQAQIAFIESIKDPGEVEKLLGRAREVSLRIRRLEKEIEKLGGTIIEHGGPLDVEG